jgi:hypothetical protein
MAYKNAHSMSAEESERALGWTKENWSMANRVFSVAAVVLGSSALISSLAVTPAAASTHHRHVVRRHPVAAYAYYPAYGYVYAPVAVAGGIVDGAGVVAANIVGGATALAGGILGGPYYGYYGYNPSYAYGYRYPVW